jgi:hypothetical protein
VDQKGYDLLLILAAAASRGTDFLATRVHGAYRTLWVTHA